MPKIFEVETEDSIYDVEAESEEEAKAIVLAQLDSVRPSATKPQEITPTGLPKVGAEAFQISSPTPQSASGFSPQLQTTLPRFGQPNQFNQPPVPPATAAQIASEIVRPIAIGGGAAAGTAAGIASVPALGPAGPFLGGATGTALGVTIADAFDRLIGVKEPVSGLREAVKETASAIGTGVETEIFGGVAGALPVAAAKSLGPKVFVNAPEMAKKVIEDAKSLGIDLTPFEVTGSKAIGKLEAIFDTLPWTSGVVQRFRLNQLQQFVNKREALMAKHGSPEDIEAIGLKIQGMVDDFFKGQTNLTRGNLEVAKSRLLQKMGATSDYYDLDVAAVQSVQKQAKDRAKKVDSLYESVRASMPDDVGVLPKEAIAVARKELAELRRLPKQFQDQELASKLEALIPKDVPTDVADILRATPEGPRRDALIDQFGDTFEPRKFTYKDLDAFRRELVQLEDANTDYMRGNAKNNAGRIYGALRKAIRNDMDALAEQTGNKEIINMNALAKKAYIDEQNFLDNDVVKKVSRETPGAITKSIFKPGNDQQVQQYRDIVGEDLFKKVKSKFVNEILNDTRNESITGDQIRSIFLGLGETSKVIFSKPELNHFRRLAKLVDGQTDVGSEIVSNPLMKRLAARGALPSKVINQIVVPNSSGQIELIERYLGKEAKKNVAEGFFTQLMGQKEVGPFNPKILAKNINRYGRKPLNALYGKEVTDDLMKLANVGQVVNAAERVNPSGTGGYLAAMGQGAFILHNPVVGTLTAFGSNLAARAYLSKPFRKWVSEGLTISPTSQRAIEVYSKLLTIFTQLQIEDLKKSEESND